MKSPQRICLMAMMALVGACGSDISATSNDSGSETDTEENTASSGATDSMPDTETTTEPETKYNVYFGLLHSHTNISDGEGSPETAYKNARDNAKLDFFGIADHDYYPDDMTAANWKTIKDAANSLNQDGTYVTFWGFEWTSDSEKWQDNGLALGHIAVINSDDFCISSYEPTRTLDQLVDWLSTRDAIAFFNHPGEYGTNFDKFNFKKSEKFVGMELWNRTTDFSYYYNDGCYSNDANLGYYDEAIQRGFYIGAAGSDDNHDGTWGTTNGGRLAVLATAKTRSSIYSALKSRRFYSTADKNLALSFTANGAQMGSKIAQGTLHFAIEASDGNGERFGRIRLLKNGVEIQEWQPFATNPNVTFTTSGNDGDYFYVIVHQPDGNQAISSPIFVTSDHSK